MIRYIFEDFPIGFVIIISCFFLMVCIPVDILLSKSEPFNGIVIDKHYKAESTKTGTGTVINSKGGIGFVSVNEHESEEFLLVVKMSNRKIVTVECEPELYYSKSINSKVACRFEKGFFTGCIWGCYGVR